MLIPCVSNIQGQLAALDAFEARYLALAAAARTRLDRGTQDTDTPEA